ncbi:MAG: hypothetical protein LIO52_05810, partial [Oscillospiraceae bacterium]|nr:hypothetical protein [Oscillospiraceae bacterium]
MSFAADDGTADSALSFTTEWSYDEENDVYYVIGVEYCTNPADTKYNNMAIYVPGAYMRGESVNGYTADTAPIVMPVNTGAYMAMTPPTSYNYSTVSSYVEAGYVYMFAGCRGQNSGDGYDHAPWGVADMKAAVRYMRLNDSVIPGDSERIVTFGHSGGGALSSVMGASGDAAEYYPYLASLGAAGIEYDGTNYTSTISDAVYGSMCWCPITELTGADMAYEWFLGQYIDSTQPTIWIEGFRSWELEENDSPRYEGYWTSMLSDDLAAGYADYVNALGLTDEDGNALKLEASDEGIYLSGSYYEYMVDVVNTSLDNFIKDHGGIDDFYYYYYS